MFCSSEDFFSENSDCEKFRGKKNLSNQKSHMKVRTYFRCNHAPFSWFFLGGKYWRQIAAELLLTCTAWTAVTKLNCGKLQSERALVYQHSVCRCDPKPPGTRSSFFICLFSGSPAASKPSRREPRVASNAATDSVAALMLLVRRWGHLAPPPLVCDKVSAKWTRSLPLGHLGKAEALL